MTSRGRDGMGARLNVDCGFLHAWNSFVVLLLLLVLASGVPRDLRHGGLCGPKGSDSLINVLTCIDLSSMFHNTGITNFA